MAVIHMIVEGVLDEAVANRIIVETDHTPGPCYPKKGFTYIKDKIKDFNKSAVSINYLALVDFMDTGLPCPGAVIATWLPNRQPRMLLRVVVREIESWLLADRENIANFLQIALSKIPDRPEELEDPKQALINLARTSKSKRIRTALVPEEGSTASEGRLYTSELSQFVNKQWNPANARQNAPSLERCCRRLQTLP
ncbi:MAG: DUF4276 family protein [Acidobacteria bacterium]|nr:DUF4276 family protein [Acidobacteriota bacterium]